MSIQVGAYDTLANPKNRVFTDERLKLFSDVQSNLLELVSSCNETTMLLDSMQIGSSNSSNLVISSLLYGPQGYRLMDIGRDVSTIYSSTFSFPGSVVVSSNMVVDGNIIHNQPLITSNILTSNIQLYADPAYNVPFLVSSNGVDLMYLNTRSNALVVLPNVGIGTTVPRYALQVQGPVYSSDGVYTSYITSNTTTASTIQVYGNLNVNGTLSSTESLDLNNTRLNLSGISISNIRYQDFPGLIVNQRVGGFPIAVVNTRHDDNTSNTMFGVSASGRTYIGVDLNNPSQTALAEASSQSNAMLTVALPYSYSNDSLLRAVGYTTSNSLIISGDAYLGMGTTQAYHPVHLHMQSNTNMLLNPLSNAATIGLYHSNLPNKPFLVASSNSTTVFYVDGSGSVGIGTSIFLGSNGDVQANNIRASNLDIQRLFLLNSNISITGLNTIQASNISCSNLVGSNLSLSNITNAGTLSTSNLVSSVFEVTSDALLNNVYITGTLTGPNITPFVGTSDSSYFIPDASGPGSVAHLRTSNVLLSLNSNYTAELSGALAGGSNGVLQVRTYPFANKPISAGVSVYGYSNSSMLVTANRPYYQLQRPGGTSYNIGVNGANELFFGTSSTTDTDIYTTPFLKMTNDLITVGNSKTFMYVNSNSSILVSTSGNDPVLTSTGGFEVKGPSLFRTGGGSTILFMSSSTGNVGIGNTDPKRKLDVSGDAVVSGSIGIGTTQPITTLHVQGASYFATNVGIGTTLPRRALDVIGSVIASGNLGIGTTTPRASLDVVGVALVSGNLGIGTTQVGAYSLRTMGDALFTGSVSVSNIITANSFVGNLAGVANSATIASNALGFITSNVTATSITTNDLTVTSTMYASNMLVQGSNTTIRSYLLSTSNVSISNVGTGPALSVLQSGSSTVADFYNTDVSTTIPALRIAGGGNVGIGTATPVAMLHVQGAGYYSGNVGIGTTLARRALDVIGDALVSQNIGIGTALPIASLHVQNQSYFASNVGIGTTLPRQLLHLQGNMLIGTSTVYAASNYIVPSANGRINNVSITALNSRTRASYASTARCVSTWTARTSAADNAWSSVCWAPELPLFCAVSSTGTATRVMTSPDGITWTTRSTSGLDNEWRSVAWAPELSLLCAVATTGAANRVMTSSNGTTWTARSTSGFDNEWRSVCWAPELSLFCAVASTGSSNRVMTSTNGITWTTRTSAADNSWQSVCWSPDLSLFCAVSSSGTGTRVMTSPDGITWTTRTSAANNAWRSVCWSAELCLFCAVSDSSAGTIANRVMTSPDGITWTAVSAATNTDWTSVVWSSSMSVFCAVSSSGSGNRVMTSLDGITWTTRTSPANNSWSAVCFAQELSIFCSVASTGTTNTYAMTSAFGLPNSMNTVFAVPNQITVLQSNGNVGIGTTTPAARLHVQGISCLVGSVGIGTTQPRTALDIIGDVVMTGNIGIGTTQVLARLHLGPGTSSLAPIQLTAGTNLTTAAAGAIEYDGTVFTMTPAANTRSVAVHEQVVVLNSAYTLLNQTGAQKVFNASANGAVSLAVGTHMFDAYIVISGVQMGSSSDFGFGLGGDATIGSQSWEAMASKGGLTANTPVQGQYTATTTTLIGTANTGDVCIASIRGVVKITSSGTIIPQVSFTVAPGASASVSTNSYFRTAPYSSTSAANIAIGNWS
jgi:hypothetical protein